MTTKHWARTSAVNKVARAINLYARPAEQRKAAERLRIELDAVLAPYLTRPDRALCNGAACSSGTDTAQRATHAQHADAAPGGEGVAPEASPLKVDSFSHDGRNLQCSVLPYEAVLAIAAVKVVEEARWREKAPEPVVAGAGQAEWPSECEVLVTGTCLNPLMLTGCLWEGGRKGRFVSLWKPKWNLRAGAVVAAKLERADRRDALYRVSGGL